MIPGSTQPQATHSHRNLSLLPLYIIEWPANYACKSLSQDIIPSLPAQLVVGWVCGSECVHHLGDAETRSDEDILHLCILEEGELVNGSLSFADSVINGLVNKIVAANWRPQEDDPFLLHPWNATV